MALSLIYTVVERNDNKLLTITDSTGTYDAVDNPTGWGVPNSVVLTGIGASGSAHTLELNVTITTSDGTSTTYDKIDLYTEFGGFTTVADLVFPLDCSMLISSGVALGTSDDEFPDGIYDITYIYDAGLGTEESTQVNVLIDGKVQNAVYELLRTIPTKYECGACHEKETLDIMFMRTYLDSIRASAVVSRADSILDQLYTLERLVTNVSYYIW